MEIKVLVPKSILTVLNQLYELEQKLKRHGDSNNVSRNVAKMKDAFANEGLPNAGGDRICLTFEDPLGKPFKETRTDLDVSISGSSTDNLVVVEVIKPIIRASVRDGVSIVVQRGVVVVESAKEQ